MASVNYTVTDEYGTLLSVATRILSGNFVDWKDSLIVEASRCGNDSDGRLYRVTATITDTAGNISIATTDIDRIGNQFKRKRATNNSRPFSLK